MPQYVSTSPWSWLAYKIGWLLGAGVGKATNEARHVARNASRSSSAERSAWLSRCLASSVIVAAAVWACLKLIGLGGSLSMVAAVISWIALAVLPTPTPRIPLMAARLTVAGTTSALLQFLVEDAIGAANDWKFPLLAGWFAIVIAMLFWSLAALRRPSPAHAHAHAGSGTRPTEPPASGSWSNVPTVKLADVGGLAAAKREVSQVAANRLSHHGANIVRNGILLYGPQGTGKNLLAEATAGEFGVNFLHVRCPELVGQNTGSGAERIRGVFESAVANRPVVLFLDEIDSIGSRKQVQGHGTDAGGGGREYNSLVTQLMQSIDQHRHTGGLLIIAATNYLDGLEPTLIRDGRFDARIRLDLPNEAERREILTALLRKHRWRSHDLGGVAKRTPGWSQARLKGLVDRAALAAQNQAIEAKHLIETLEETGGRDQESLEPVGWDDVVLPEYVMADLRTLLDLMKPGRAEELSLPAPTGLILVGPPGTGKTLVARLVASQAKRSFYAVSPSEVLGGAVGGSVKRLSEIFRRAKDNAPSIVFFDEMDGLFPLVHGHLSQHDVQLVEQALIEISALRPEHQVFLIGTTNHLDRIDPRILRGGRFSEKVEIPVPDEHGYRRLIIRYLGKARLARDLSVADLAARVAGVAPADLEATIQAAKRVAMRRMSPGVRELPPLGLADFEEALGRVQPRF